MTEPPEPQEIARHTFNVTRRGYDQQAVRGFLHEVSALVERLERSERELLERAERAEAKLSPDQRPDESALLELLGEETTRVLTSARDAAAEIRDKAEEAATRVIAAATAEAAEIRGNAVRDTDALKATAKAESDAILEEARTELERRRAEAQEAASAIRQEGEAAAAAIRAAGEAELAQARAEGEAALEAARQEGRGMVAEAQAVRERVLRDLAVRRKRARQQVEKLNAGRERLLAAYEVVRRTADEATDELSTALLDARLAADAAARRIDEEPEPSIEQLDEEVANAGLIDLPIAAHDHSHDDDSPGPFSGEVPAITGPAPEAELPSDQEALPTAALPSEPEGPRLVELGERRAHKRRKKGFEGLPPAELTVVEPPSEDEGVRVFADPAVEAQAVVEEQAPGAEPTGATTPEAEATADEAAETAAEDAAVEEPASEEAAAEDAAVEEPASEEAAAEDAAVEEPASEEATVEEPGDDDAAVEEATADEAGEPADIPSAADVFARLRAGRAAQDEPAGDGQPVAPEAEDEAKAPPEVEPPTEVADALAEPADAVSRTFAARRAALASVDKELARRLKRRLADEQNEVLDLLRRAKPSGVDDLLPGVDEHAARWADAATGSLADAAAAGADWSGGAASSVADLADELARSLTTPLRERIDRSFAASDGNLDDVADRVRALYREWKGQRLGEACTHFVAAAYARGVFDGLAPGSLVRWVVDPAAGPCPDCDDNVLAGAITKGTEFPTGNACAPAHPGCHCLVLAAEG
jgi:DivIVA domain-containing protein